MRILRLAALILGSTLLAVGASAQNFVEIVQDATLYNFRKTNGVPLSSTVGVPPGSDGRIPVTPPEGETANPATANQFQGLISFGGLAAPTDAAALIPSQSYVGNARSIGLPHATSNGVVVLVLRSARLGSPFLNRQVSFQFGAVIPVPSVDENGATLTHVAPVAYWSPEPHSTNEHAGAGYYWSRHARLVFAIQPGPVDVVWKKAAPGVHPGEARPSDWSTNAASYFVEGANYYKLHPVRHIASGSAVKSPQKMYWTEATFRDTGKPVDVPATRISTVKIVYNNYFPETVAHEYVAEGQSLATDATNTFQVRRTLWHDTARDQLLAYNAEGRVFVELLGDTRPDGLSKEHLGFEIVDVMKQPKPAEVTTELGDLVRAYPDGRDDSALDPEPISFLRDDGKVFLFEQATAGATRREFYAIRETENQNDVLFHWLQESLQGIRWPERFVRYRQVWPPDVARYSHYVRQLALTEEEAAQTAVPMPRDNVPVIAYQDPFQPLRAHLTDQFAFYTRLDATVPAHRALLRFSSGEHVAFERVFSWLDVNLKTTNFVGTVATNLNQVASYLTNVVNDPAPAVPWPNASMAPRVITDTVAVGQRIAAPAGELGSSPGDPYLAGHLHTPAGTSYHPEAYVDPLADGFEAANLGAIIPVNSIPGANALEVWWFRTNAPDLAHGFRTIHWPSIIGRYTIEWPAQPREIVLASNDGSGALTSLETRGSIYQAHHDPALPGYNPNEEHALMLGGQAYALRDDLNRTNSIAPAVLSGPGTTFSSLPFVLLDYTEADGRPALGVFKVLREKPSEGILFDYITEAGHLLQAPMPLPFLAPPVEWIANGTAGGYFTNYNVEPPDRSADLPIGWASAAHSNFEGSANRIDYNQYGSFTFKDRKDGFWVYRGLHAGLPALEAGAYDDATGQFSPLPDAQARVGEPFTNHVHVSRRAGTLLLTAFNLPAGLVVDGLTVRGIPGAAGTNQVTLVLTDTAEGSAVTNTFALGVSAAEPVVSQGPLIIESTNSYTHTQVSFQGRPPYLALSPTNTNSFTMRFYYKTQEGFAWPGRTTDTTPAVGTIVPYLLPRDSADDPASRQTPSLDIVYRPTWPATAPILAPGQTLTVPTAGLPAVRGQSSLTILYQQSLGTHFTSAMGMPSVVLHDPTREKEFALGAAGLAELPPSVRVDHYQGRVYFPELPPHLADRFYFDPARGTRGRLVLKGEFKDELFGEKYLLLNVLGPADLATVKALCPDTDSAHKGAWDAAIDGLSARLERFQPDRDVPGTFTVRYDFPVQVPASQLVQINNDGNAVDSYALSATGPGDGFVVLLAGNNLAFTPEGEPVSLHLLRVGGPLYRGEVKVLPSANPLNELLTLQHTGDLAARTAEYEYDWRIAPPVDGLPLRVNAENPTMSGWNNLANDLDVPRFTLGGAGIQVLVDNYITVRYRPAHTNHALSGEWSGWTTPALAEGWIKRVLAGLNPFNQRVTDLFNNTVNTDASILTQAGRRWEGDVALNLENIDNYGLIEIYETVLRRGKALSIGSGINFGPANDALLLAAGYLNDLYMMHGHEAFADAANPTIGIGTADNTYGDIATALFAFKGQVATLLDEELALLRGRDEFLQPGVTVAPVYNRLVWNYTRGIDSGEVIYALNYNILDQDVSGAAGPADAARLYPQGHGDAYGHYLTALKGYYALLLDTDFDWVPRIEAVTVLGQPVSVDYLDERKFAAAASAVARTGRQICDLAWRQEYRSGTGLGWDHFAPTRSSATRTRSWGLDHWTSRTGQGAYLNWIVGNAILPEVDPDPTHEGIQKVDRTTVPELEELPVVLEGLQISMDNAEAGLTPLGLPESSIPFDLNPNTIVSEESQTHFEQVNERAKATLRNASLAFDEAKDVTRLMRSEQDSLAELRASVERQEIAFTNALIELFGTPYPEDIGPGKLYPTGYAGPDFFHHAYVNDARLQVPTLVDGGAGWDFQVDVQPRSTIEGDLTRFGRYQRQLGNAEYSAYVTVHLDAAGFFQKPASYVGRRVSPGRLQEAIGQIIVAHNALRMALEDNKRLKYQLDRQLELFDAKNERDNFVQVLSSAVAAATSIKEITLFAIKMTKLGLDTFTDRLDDIARTTVAAIPTVSIFGLANGGDVTSAARGAILAASATAKAATGPYTFALEFLVGSTELLFNELIRNVEADVLLPLRFEREDQAVVHELELVFADLRMSLFAMNQRAQELENARSAYFSLLARGDRILAEREIARQRAAAIVQGYRTRDAAFRIFRNEKLERYKTLFDLAARYAFMAAQAYDYETGQLGTTAGRDFVSRIIRARALGVVRDGEPQFAGGNTGDPGLSSALAEMQVDWLVLRGRLGFNNPDAYGTTMSLRQEQFRLLPGADGDSEWKEVLHRGRLANLLDDADVKRHCLQIDPGNGLPVPGIVLTFSTTIADGYNLFGRQLAAGDHNYSSSSFATKIFGVGVALEGYRGMDNPAANSGGVGGGGGTSPPDPDESHLDPLALAATPYVYLIPVGVDAMRSPPLGDVSTVRTWNVDDVAVPLPFNLGASDFSSRPLWQSSDSLSEPLFAIRKHQAFRPVSTTEAFSTGIFGDNGSLQRSQFTNTRLVGRSVWNSRWKLIIPGKNLLNDANEGLERFIATVEDIELHFVTYSYSGN